VRNGTSACSGRARLEAIVDKRDPAIVWSAGGLCGGDGGTSEFSHVADRDERDRILAESLDRFQSTPLALLRATLRPENPQRAVLHARLGHRAGAGLISVVRTLGGRFPWGA